MKQRQDRVAAPTGLRKAIRLKCLDCCCGSEKEVRLCTSYRCPLWPHRMNRPLRESDHGVAEYRAAIGGST